MRFRGGGIGHIYMRQVEPWLDATGWGTSWPLLEGRDPDPDSEPVTPANGDEATSDEEESDTKDSEDEGSDIDDDDGEDPEQPDEEEDESDDDDVGGDVKRPMEGGEGGSDGNETDDEVEESAQLFASL